MSETVIYTIADCPYCKAAKDDLRSRAVPYREIDVAGDAGARDEMIALSGDNTVPVIIEDGKVSIGYGGG
ncbi:MAG: glutaredoxin family protein [Dehalococcoidia bacterium]|nr:glutaredoxin family protein [Dehalococcoidia bacterium]